MKYLTLAEMSYDDVKRRIKSVADTIIWSYNNDNTNAIRDCLDYLRNVKASSYVLKVYDDYSDVYKMSPKDILKVAPAVVLRLLDFYSLKISGTH